MSLGAPELIILLMVLVLFGYKKLPDASRAFGRSLRIFKSEMKVMKEDDPVSRHSTMNDQIAASSSAGKGQESA